MSITFGELKTRVANVLLDPNGRTFTEPMVEELIHRALVEIGRILPEQFTEDLTPVADQMTYQPRSNDFGITYYDVTGEADTELFTSTAHGLAAGDAIKFGELTGGTGLTTTDVYFVADDENLDEDNFTLVDVNAAAVTFSVDLTAGTWFHYGSGQAVPDIDITRVEIWDASAAPESFVSRIPAAAHQPVAGQDSGWYVWNGTLYIPNRFVAALNDYTDSYVIRIWGYSPYLHPEQDDDLIAVGREAENAMVMYIHLDALRMLLNDRNLFTQWQTRSGNVDTSLAGLANEKNAAASDWRVYSRSIQRLRSLV